MVTTELIVLPTKPASLVDFLSTVHSVSHKTTILSQRVLPIISRPLLASPFQAFTESVSSAYDTVPPFLLTTQMSFNLQFRLVFRQSSFLKAHLGIKAFLYIPSAPCTNILSGHFS